MGFRGSPTRPGTRRARREHWTVHGARLIILTIRDHAFTSQYLRESHDRLTKSMERAQCLAGDLNAAQLNWKPRDDQWSIAQCLEHLLVVADRYSEKLGRAIERAHGKNLHASADDRRPRHTVIGALILQVVEPTAKRVMSSPKIFDPGPSQISDDVLNRFAQGHENIAALMSECNGLDLNRMKLSSPVSLLLRINVADAFEIIVAHAERHLNQAQRVRNSTGFPRGKVS